MHGAMDPDDNTDPIHDPPQLDAESEDEETLTADDAGQMVIDSIARDNAMYTAGSKDVPVKAQRIKVVNTLHKDIENL
jgi:hypothetical protein